MATITILLILIVVGYFFGKHNEFKHYQEICRKEEELRYITVLPVRTIPEHLDCKNAALVTGSVVVAMDFFKVVSASIVQIFGGNIRAYETLLERARREAVIRMKEDAAKMGAKYVINVKLSTANIMSQSSRSSGGGIEAIAYGTAIIE